MTESLQLALEFECRNDSATLDQPHLHAHVMLELFVLWLEAGNWKTVFRINYSFAAEACSSKIRQRST